MTDCTVVSLLRDWGHGLFWIALLAIVAMASVLNTRAERSYRHGYEDGFMGATPAEDAS